MKRANKQLIIRLSIVSVVLAVGVAAIANSLISSKNKSTAQAGDKDAQPTQVAQQNPADPAKLKPIPATASDVPPHSAVEQPSASPTFSRPPVVRPVSLEQQLTGGDSRQPATDPAVSATVSDTLVGSKSGAPVPQPPATTPLAPAFGGGSPARAASSGFSNASNSPATGTTVTDAPPLVGDTAGNRSVYAPPFGAATSGPGTATSGASPVAVSGTRGSVSSASPSSLPVGSPAAPSPAGLGRAVPHSSAETSMASNDPAKPTAAGTGFPIAIPPTATNLVGGGSGSAEHPAERTEGPTDAPRTGLSSAPKLPGASAGLATAAAGVGAVAGAMLGSNVGGAHRPAPFANPMADQQQTTDGSQRTAGTSVSPTQMSGPTAAPQDPRSTVGQSGNFASQAGQPGVSPVEQANFPANTASTQASSSADSPPVGRFAIGTSPAPSPGQSFTPRDNLSASTGQIPGQIPDGQIPDTLAGTQARPASTGATPEQMRQLVAQATELPGDQKLEGQQLPSIAIEKTAPEEIQVNRKAVFQVLVRNTGKVPAHNVVVVDRVPRGTRLVTATPQATQTESGVLIWQLGTLEPGREVTLAMEVLPQMEGEIGSVAQVSFQAQASVRSICTKPKLSVKLVAPEKVLIGQTASLDISVTNTGTGAATNVILEEDVPEGFTHAAGGQLEHSIGTLRPGQSVRLTLVLDAAKVGFYENRLTVRGDGELSDQNVHSIQVIAPKLQMTMTGPARRYLDRQATYALQISNPGTAPANNIETVVFLPRGMKYVTSDNQGQYDPQTHGVYWSLKELSINKQGEVHLTVLPIEPGDQKLRVEGKADLGLAQTFEQQIRVEGIAELRFALTDLADPIEVGSDTTYEVRIRNHGSKADTNIQVIATLPEGLKPTTGDGPTRATVQGQQVAFAPIARLAPDEEVLLRIHAHGNTAGDHVIRVQLQSDELKVPVAKEEITRVYSDR